ncbi:MAG: hypothetical protein ACYS4W_11770 [Planctomycetota bacterium]
MKKQAMRTDNCCKMNRALIMFAVLGLVALPAAFAVPIPSEGVHADAFARYQDTSDGPVVVDDPVNAEAQALVVVLLDDKAEGHGRASILGGVGSSIWVMGAEWQDPEIHEDIVANSTASQVTNWIATTTDPAVTTADIDMAMSVDGFFEYYDGAGVGPGDLFAEVFFQANVYRSGDVAPVTVFEATARLDSSTSLSTSGPWGAAFTSVPPGLGGDERWQVDYSEIFPAAFTVPTNETFGGEVLLGTAGYAVGPYELAAFADFLNTGSFELSTSTSGVTLARIQCTEPLAMDFTDDCKVDFKDFAKFVQSWLECNLDPPEACWE